jgi:class 3 adenylate cyclase
VRTNYSAYDHLASVSRINEILEGADTSYEEVDSIPSRDKLTFNNGFYVYCSALFVDIRGSSGLPSKYKRPTLAKIYRSYISEAVAIINGNSNCAEINIVGDSVAGIFNTPSKPDIDEVFSTAARINSLIDILNCRLKARNIDPIRAGIGMSYGRALMIKAGYKGSSINDVVWMGDVVNEAAKLCSYGSKNSWDPPIVVSSVFHNNLNDHNKGLLSYRYPQGYYTGNVVNTELNHYALKVHRLYSD